jgi:excisionase family DNA binding protein
MEVRLMLINIDDAARFLGLQPSTLRRWIYERKISYVKLGRRVLFRKEVIEQLIRASEKPALEDPSTNTRQKQTANVLSESFPSF